MGVYVSKNKHKKICERIVPGNPRQSTDLQHSNVKMKSRLVTFFIIFAMKTWSILKIIVLRQH